MIQQIAEKPVKKQPNLLYRKVKNEEQKDGEKSSGGLCSTCRYAKTCIFTGNSTRPVYECNEYEVAEAPERIRTREGKESIDRLSDKQYQGLCMNCENRSSCIYASTEGGVWHCEEYR